MAGIICNTEAVRNKWGFFLEWTTTRMGINEAPVCSDDDCDEPSKEETATFDTACQERYHLHDKLGQYVVSYTSTFVDLS